MTDQKAAIVVGQLVEIAKHIQTLIQFLAGDNSKAALEGLKDALAEEAAILADAGDKTVPSP